MVDPPASMEGTRETRVSPQASGTREPMGTSPASMEGTRVTMVPPPPPQLQWKRKERLWWLLQLQGQTKETMVAPPASGADKMDYGGSSSFRGRQESLWWLLQLQEQTRKTMVAPKASGADKRDYGGALQLQRKALLQIKGKERLWWLIQLQWKGQ